MTAHTRGRSGLTVGTLTIAGTLAFVEEVSADKQSPMTVFWIFVGTGISVVASLALRDACAILLELSDRR